MKQSDIYRAFDHIRPDQEAKMRMLENIQSAASETPPGGKEIKMKRTNWKKTLLIAAMISVMVFLMGCAVIMMNLQNLKIGEHHIKRGVVLDSEGNIVKESYIVKDVISLQGIKDSPSQQAAKEWLEFYDAYNVDDQLIWDSESAEYTAPRDYDAYFVYNQTMQSKIDEIAEKYGLKLAGPIALTQIYQQDIFFDALELDGLTKSDAEILLEDGAGYFYACGNFKLEFWLTMTGADTQWHHENLLSYIYKDKDYFDTVYCYVEDVDSITQWNHTLTDGTEVLLVNTDERGWIFCDREDAFISVGFDTTHGSNAMSQRDMEMLAETLDFTVKPRKPDMEKSQRKLAERETEYLTQQEELWQELGTQLQENPYKHNSYAELINYISQHEENFLLSVGDQYRDFAETCSYALLDVTGDGEEELIIGRDGRVTSIWYMIDGKTSGEWGSDELYICEGGIREQYVFRDGEPEHYYSVIGTGGEIKIYIGYDSGEGSWKYRDFATDTEPKPIAEEDAMKIIGSYVRMEFDWKPISEFPMD